LIKQIGRVVDAFIGAGTSHQLAGIRVTKLASSKGIIYLEGVYGHWGANQNLGLVGRACIDD
jgi:hypothetical protein